MNITLTPELERLVNEEIMSGDYDSPSEVLRQGLLLLKERKAKREDLRREIQKGIDDVKEGRSKTYDSADELIEEVISEARAEFATRKANGK